MRRVAVFAFMRARQVQIAGQRAVFPRFAARFIDHGHIKSLASYSIYENSGIAMVKYTCGDTLLTDYILKEDGNEMLGNLLHQGEIQDRFELDREDFKIEGTERKEKGDLRSTYVGYWIYENCFYDISGKVNKDDFKEILKNIVF